MNIYIGNLAQNLTEDVLKNMFEEFGEVESIKIIKDRFSGLSKGFGFVKVADQAAVDKAVAELNGQELDGRALNISQARPREDKPRGPRN